jgi:two-component sensor histidine kinase
MTHWLPAGMHRLADLDVASSFGSGPRRLAVQLLFGVACGVGYVALRSGVDVFAHSAGAFALIYPFILIATLFGHWRAGVVAFLISFSWAWFVLLQPTMDFQFTSEVDRWRVLLNASSALMLIFMADAFRQAVRQRARERDEEIERSEMLRRELEHRTKNNFALLGSLLEIQRRHEKDPAAKQALELASHRLWSFSTIYTHLPVGPSVGEDIPVKPYLMHLVDSVAAAVFEDDVAVNVDIAEAHFPRQTALAMALYVNEALTNCAKHAFDPEEPGSVEVSFRVEGNEWFLSVTDDGKGISASGDSGSGSTLMGAFAKQAHAVHEMQAGDNGCRVSLRGTM